MSDPTVPLRLIDILPIAPPTKKSHALSQPSAHLFAPKVSAASIGHLISVSSAPAAPPGAWPRIDGALEEISGEMLAGINQSQPGVKYKRKRRKRRG